MDSRFSRLRTEINNGRLAMLGIMAFLAESKVPGSVPALNGLGIAPYSGEVPSEGSIARPGCALWRSRKEVASQVKI